MRAKISTLSNPVPSVPQTNKTPTPQNTNSILLHASQPRKPLDFVPPPSSFLSPLCCTSQANLFIFSSFSARRTPFKSGASEESLIHSTPHFYTVRCIPLFTPPFLPPFLLPLHPFVAYLNQPPTRNCFKRKGRGWIQSVHPFHSF